MKVKHKKSNFSKYVLIVPSLLIAIYSKNVFAIDDFSNLEKNNYSKQYIQWSQLSDDEKENTVQPIPTVITYEYEDENRIKIENSILNQKRLLINSKYDLRNDITVRVKDQKSTGGCWTFSTTSVLETTLAKTKNETWDFSERHMNYVTSRNFLDGENSSGYNREVKDGGNPIIGLSYYTSGKGPVKEEDMPFSVDESKINLSEIQGKNVVKKVEDYVIFPIIYKEKVGDTITYKGEKGDTFSAEEVNTIRNSIKEHIMNYGAVTSMTYSQVASQYLNTSSEYPSYYCDDPNAVANHQITIIGWDDNYAVTNFNENNRPSNPGAYLVLNSYGKTDVYKDGCYYISYEDCLIETGVTGIVNVGTIDYDNIYQYDELRSIFYIKFTRYNNFIWSKYF